MGNRGFAGKWSHYEESLRVPMVIYDPRVPERKKGAISDGIVLNIDITSTILDLAGVQLPDAYQGASLMPLVYGTKVKNWRDSFFCEHRMENEKIPQFVGFRGERYVYARYYTQTPEYEYLHDLEKDPDQLINFVNDPNYEDILKEMRTKCNIAESNIKSVSYTHLTLPTN